MNIYLDTATEDFVLILFDDNFNVIDSTLMQGYKKKVHLITEQFEELLIRNNLEVQNLKGLYTNIGPGFFTGVRSSLVYFQTISLMTNIPMYITNSFALLQKQSENDILVLDAQGGKKYLFNTKNTNVNEQTVTVENSELPVQKINFENIIHNFVKYQDCFLQKEAMDIEPLYIKKPQIGGQ
ncbi:tRNA (adenosine(37)-N6)-threonylcarbamoyltransferase complex dimerization subunit type 1 TsaB [Mycoplasma hafezii]|uniref:tRNA (adenosine(37)-N6)-threonylcarbamoyltransferase complex dimerization subunit type 1 TsaB n=1 Tax=Mycoplasma hafezii TaxID=525886 RepID=UPI003CECD836